MVTLTTRPPRPTTRAASASAGTICFTEPTRLDLCAYRGDTGRFRVYVFDADGAPMDVTLAEWDCDVRETTEGEVLFSMEVVEVEGYPNQVEVMLTSDQSALLFDENVWDLEMTWAGEVITLFAGNFTASGDVSRP